MNCIYPFQVESSAASAQYRFDTPHFAAGDFIFSISCLFSLSAFQRSTARCTFNQNSGVFPNNLDSLIAIEGDTVRRSSRSSFSVCRETPFFLARPVVVNGFCPSFVNSGYQSILCGGANVNNNRCDNIIQQRIQPAIHISVLLNLSE